MTYHTKFTRRVADGAATLGPHLGRWAVHRKVGVSLIARITGATRATVYNWLNGGTVSNAYQDTVIQLINILKTAADAEAVWSQACRTFPRLQPSPTKNSYGTQPSRSSTRPSPKSGKKS